MGWLNLPRFQQMLDIIDPLAYPIAMEHVPKHVVVASMDEFFMPGRPSPSLCIACSSV